MTAQAQLALLLFFPITLFLFSKYPPRKPITFTILGALLFLPQKTKFLLPLIPDYAGMNAAYYGILVGLVVFKPKISNQFKMSWVDLPMVLFCTAPIISSLSNGLGFYDGLNASLGQLATFGFPYFLGRIYFNNVLALKHLAISIVKAGLIYTPLCLYEIRMSPQIHRMVYGYFPHSFAQTMRYGGWRPQVFMSHGLSLSLFMMACCLIAIWLWQGKVVRKIWGIPIRWVSLILLVIVILNKSTGVYLLTLIGLTVMFLTKLIRLNLPLIILMLGIVVYLFISIIGFLDVEKVVSLVADVINPERAQSLGFRLENEKLLLDKAKEKILFGWGGWGRNRVYEENWQGIMQDVTITDSTWIITLGVNGLWGLINLMISLLLPVYRLILSIPAREWFNSNTASASVLGVVLTLCIIDSLFNTPFGNGLYTLLAGGLLGLSINQFDYRRKGLKKLRVIRKPVT